MHAEEDGIVALIEDVIAVLEKLRLRPRGVDDPTTVDRFEELILRLQHYVAAAPMRLGTGTATIVQLPLR